MLVSKVKICIEDKNIHQIEPKYESNSGLINTPNLIFFLALKQMKHQNSNTIASHRATREKYIYDTRFTYWIKLPQTTYVILKPHKMTNKCLCQDMVTVAQKFASSCLVTNSCILQQRVPHPHNHRHINSRKMNAQQSCSQKKSNFYDFTYMLAFIFTQLKPK